MAIQNVIISLVLRGHSLGSQLLREIIRKVIPAKKPVSSLSYRRIMGEAKCQSLSQQPLSQVSVTPDGKVETALFF